MTTYSINNVCESIWNIEKNLNLFELKIDNIYFWKLIRFKIFIIISNKLGIISRDSQKYNLGQKFKYLFESQVYNILYSSIKGRYQRNILIFENPRKVLVNKEYIDPYTYYFVKQLEILQSNYEIISRPYQLKYYGKSIYKRKFKNITLLDLIKYKISMINITEKEKMLFKIIENEIYKAFSISLNIHKIVVPFLKRFKVDYIYYNNLIKKRNPEKIFLVASYGFESLIAAARYNNVKTIEFQHGIISKYHLAYSYPGINQVPYFPDEMKMFGTYWYDTTPLPLSKSNIDFCGFEYLNQLLPKYKLNKTEKKRILFISQASISQKIYTLAYDFAKIYSDFNVFFRLHPKEINTFVDNNITLNNFIIDKGEIHLYEQLDKADYVIGASSTAIFEAIMFDCKIILIDSSLTPNLDSLGDNLIPIAFSASDIYNNIIKYNDKKINLIKEAFFAQVSNDKNNCL